MVVERRVTTQDITWFLDQHRHKQLDLDPPYQRRSVWSTKDRRFFLDTIFRGYPSPPIFLYKQVRDGKTIYSVVDGKQRLETILLFADNKIAIDRKFGDIRLDGRRWKVIQKDEKLAHSFWDYVLSVEFTNITDDTNLVNEVFDRLNRNSRRLVEQELRHARYDGWFISFAETESESPEWEELGVVTRARAKRMRDVQFLSELLIVALKGRVGGFDQDEISHYCAEFDDLNDLDVPFDEDKTKMKFVAAKQYLLQLERSAKIVSRYATDFTNLYSLWGVVCLHLDDLPKVEEFVARYSAFMEDVNKFKDEDYLAKVIKRDERPTFDESLKYYRNSIGPSTEAPQRQERDQALISIILGGSTHDEDFAVS